MANHLTNFNFRQFREALKKLSSWELTNNDVSDGVALKHSKYKIARKSPAPRLSGRLPATTVLTDEQLMSVNALEIMLACSTSSGRER